MGVVSLWDVSLRPAFPADAQDLAKCVKRMRNEHNSFQQLQMARRGREIE